ncbi:hypothetical protein AB0K60_21665 [Thermopolyspora sp. NPDC052614]|uniref:hypothetical protein n=1 Tax=Thermopolyspora sp. NPDC052614 TaxID=3155682 RepID=UPI003431CE90
MTTARAGRHGGGRHRAGAACTPWARVRWDVRERAAAAGLDAIEPGWLVIWRLWARRFYAVPAWPLPWAGLLGVESRTVAGLQEEMRRAERAGWADGSERLGAA